MTRRAKKLVASLERIRRFKFLRVAEELARARFASINGVPLALGVKRENEMELHRSANVDYSVTRCTARGCTGRERGRVALSSNLECRTSRRRPGYSAVLIPVPSRERRA